MDDALASGAVLPSGRFSGRTAFGQLVRDAFACAAREGWRELLISDATFEDWPLQELVVASSLGAWAKNGRRFVMLASSYDTVIRKHARFVRWRQTWGHIVECRLSRQTDPGDFPSALLGPHWAMQRLDLARSTGVCSDRAERRVQLREAVDELLLGSSPGFPSSVLGL